MVKVARDRQPSFAKEKNVKLNRLAIALALAVVVLTSAWIVGAFAFPDKPIEVILPWPPGTETDVGTRVVTQAMSKSHGVPVQVINKPGAAAVIGSTEVTKARPDGYTIGSLIIGPMVSPVIAGNTPYQLADFG